MNEIKVNFPPHLDPGFVPAKLWNAAYQLEVSANKKARPIALRLSRPDGQAWVMRTRMLPAEAQFETLNARYGERLAKALLWSWGGCLLEISGAPDLAAHLGTVYAVDGPRAFDAKFMGPTCFQRAFRVMAVERIEALESSASSVSVNRDMRGCRIGFDLGGSDRKCAATIEGEVVFSEEIKWDPYFQSDPNYHVAGIRDSLKRAAAKLPRVDVIGGSAAGIYIDNEPCIGSLFRGIDENDFNKVIRPVFRNLQQEFGGIPFDVANDGDVTALSGAISLEENSVLGISMGTSEAAGFVDAKGAITGKFNELAFVPVDYRADASRDEWSGDLGCGAQYFSQQAVGRLIPLAGLQMDAAIPLPEKLEAVQERMLVGDDRAAAIYKTIGTYFGYSIAHYADFYDFRHLLLLGRVTSGEGGRILQETAEEVLANEFPAISEACKISMPNETMKRHGQAVAAASLPKQ
jgi:predicted NBD/HSP70 family sugar kinase